MVRVGSDRVGSEGFQTLTGRVGSGRVGLGNPCSARLDLTREVLA